MCGASERARARLTNCVDFYIRSHYRLHAHIYDENIFTYRSSAVSPQPLGYSAYMKKNIRKGRAIYRSHICRFYMCVCVCLFNIFEHRTRVRAT